MAVSIACSRSANPTKADLAAVIRILRYLLHSPSVKLTFHRQPSTKPAIIVYVDAAWSNAPKCRSRYGYGICVNACPIMWETRVTTMVCLSTAEAEHVASVRAAKTPLWLASMCSELCGVPPQQVTMYEDNKACIQMTNNPVVSARNRHFAMRMWWIREQVENGHVLSPPSIS